MQKQKECDIYINMRVYEREREVKVPGGVTPESGGRIVHMILLNGLIRRSPLIGKWTKATVSSSAPQREDIVLPRSI